MLRLNKGQAIFCGHGCVKLIIQITRGPQVLIGTEPKNQGLTATITALNEAFDCSYIVIELRSWDFSNP
jgi:hypothetical protein